MVSGQKDHTASRLPGTLVPSACCSGVIMKSSLFTSVPVGTINDRITLVKAE